MPARPPRGPGRRQRGQRRGGGGGGKWRGAGAPHDAAGRRRRAAASGRRQSPAQRYVDGVRTPGLVKSPVRWRRGAPRAAAAQRLVHVHVVGGHPSTRHTLAVHPCQSTFRSMPIAPGNVNYTSQIRGVCNKHHGSGRFRARADAFSTDLEPPGPGREVESGGRSAVSYGSRCGSADSSCRPTEPRWPTLECLRRAGVARVTRATARCEQYRDSC